MKNRLARLYRSPTQSASATGYCGPLMRFIAMASNPDPKPDTIEPAAPPETPPVITPDEQPQIDPTPGPGEVTEPAPDIADPGGNPMETPPPLD